MRTINARQLVFGLMIGAVAVCAVAYAGNSAPWANSAYAVPAGSSTPAKPEIWSGPQSSPVKLEVVWGPSTTDTFSAPPVSYDVTVDGATQVSLPATTSAQHWVIAPVTPGSSHECTVVARAGGFYSVPATKTLTVAKAPVALGKPSVPSTGRTTRSIKVSGKVVSAYPQGRSSVVKLKIYRHRKTKAGKWYWDLSKTVTAKRPSSSTYSLYYRIKRAGTYSVMAQTYATSTHIGDRSKRSSSVKIR